MPTKLRRLKEEAREACKLRGHKLGNFFSPFETCRDGIRVKWARAYCKYCNMHVTVNPKPLPNDMDICGNTVALNCSSKKIRSNND